MRRLCADMSVVQLYKVRAAKFVFVLKLVTLHHVNIAADCVIVGKGNGILH